MSRTMLPRGHIVSLRHPVKTQIVPEVRFCVSIGAYMLVALVFSHFLPRERSFRADLRLQGR